MILCGRNRQIRPKSFRPTPELNEERRGGYLRNCRKNRKLLTSSDRDCREIQQLQTGRVSTINKFSAVTGVTVRGDGGQQGFSGLDSTVDAFHIKVLLRNSANPLDRPNSLKDLRNADFGLGLALSTQIFTVAIFNGTYNAAIALNRAP